MIIDLHIHTKRLSPCSEMDPEEAFSEAEKIGLDGICFTEHNKPWDHDEILKVAEKFKVSIFHGIEVDTTEGHVLVFGLQKNFQGVTPIEDLHQMVNEVDGFMVAAHPFRGFLLFGFSKLQMNVDNAINNPLFKLVDGIEVCSGRQTSKENEFSYRVCERLGLRSVGGSDAHTIKDVGKCATFFENRIENQEDLIRELKTGRFHAGYFRTD
ncbi:MAG: PHP domain-containing protein [Pseudomonadota bacterium]